MNNVNKSNQLLNVFYFPKLSINNKFRSVQFGLNSAL